MHESNTHAETPDFTENRTATNRRRRTKWALSAATVTLLGLQIAGAGSAFAGREDVWQDRIGTEAALARQCAADGGTQLTNIRTYDSTRVMADCKRKVK
ncbi:hypothetical protein ACFS5L_11025 [Streptomyces phyllanthi]|uniref:Uncharacterized protein n=1 Tax=Streptomyces phyllanthi TaxID=1803180 RepID=A0A5N8WBN8_9ACTN|nr:hypothetical protein [Streptomyces phyllanthi]MPY44887.1 hypothetical protein [Streptomyces phyllanthi]